MATDGVLVDHTPPELIDIGTENRTRYQQRDDVLHLVWDFQDPESGIEQYRCVVFQLYHVSRVVSCPFCCLLSFAVPCPFCCVALASAAVCCCSCTT